MEFLVRPQNETMQTLPSGNPIQQLSGRSGHRSRTSPRWKHNDGSPVLSEPRNKDTPRATESGERGSPGSRDTTRANSPDAANRRWPADCDKRKFSRPHRGRLKRRYKEFAPSYRRIGYRNRYESS